MNNYATNKLLMEVGISPDLSGYHYLKSAIESVKEMILGDKVNDSFMNLYAKIAVKFNTTSSRVERAMRHAVEKATELNNASFKGMFNTLVDGNDNPTNSCFVYTLAEHLIMEEGE